MSLKSQTADTIKNIWLCHQNFILQDNCNATENCEENWTDANFTQCLWNNTGEEVTNLSELYEMIKKLTISPYGNPQVEKVFTECIRTILTIPKPNDGRLYCSRTFDGWGCWNDTLAGSVAYTPCPNFVPGFLSGKYAHKLCNKDGSWYRHPDTNKTWSNYTTCIDHEDLSFRQQINTLYVIGYSLSLVALLVSLFIFCYFRALQCKRTTIHKNLFLSFLINNVFWIIWYLQVVQKPDILVSNEAWCQILHVIVHYFMVSNYFWMFCEGLYLHTILVIAFVSESKLMKWFYFLGWGIPLLLTILYAILRGLISTSVAYCWIEESIYLWILSGPVCASMLLNLIFLINIIRVLLSKLHSVNSPANNQTRKAVRATVILIPLLGLHYLLTPFRPVQGSSGEVVYEVISATVTSSQGLCVSLLFCFFNGEVTTVIRKKWRDLRTVRQTSKRITRATTVSVVSAENLIGRWKRKDNLFEVCIFTNVNSVERLKELFSLMNYAREKLSTTKNIRGKSF
ncbi:calcitonin gene-related peptide type 1 receptor-like isoform X1 [Centruroides vittatus]|uniref:calcitonin gene-related peptide type 1 receptor-like isoform X1 n=1 Tax=Centruroides vittatus TaxID=120091 RepID=UPI00350FBC77